MSLTTIPVAAVAIRQDDAFARAASYAGSAKAKATLAAYEQDWADWQAWCAAGGHSAVPATPECVGAYLADRAETLKPATLARRLVAISYGHALHGEALNTKHPAIRNVMQGIRRQHGIAQRKVAPATRAVMLDMTTTSGEGLIDLRDRALLLFGYAAALRRSELVAVAVEDIEEVPEGLKVTIRRSKTDQEGAGDLLVIPRSNAATLRALKDWMGAAQITSGPLFRSVDRHGKVGNSLSDKAVALIVKKKAKDAGLDATRFSGHSLRAGMITSAAAAGAEERDIQRKSRHRSVAVLRGYVRPATAFVNDVADKVGL